MSYDLRIGVKVENTDIIAVIDEPERNSPTYNLGKMLRACTGWDFDQGEWYKVSEVLPLIEHGVKELYINEDAYKQYNAPNGWGTTISARGGFGVPPRLHLRHHSWRPWMAANTGRTLICVLVEGGGDHAECRIYQRPCQCCPLPGLQTRKADLPQ